MSNKIGSAYVVYEGLINRVYVNLAFNQIVSDIILAELWEKGDKSTEVTKTTPLDPVFCQRILRHNPQPFPPLGNQNQ